jgi:hypothetical protein
LKVPCFRHWELSLLQYQLSWQKRCIVFFCGELKAKKASLSKFDVPVCDVCSKDEITKYYVKGEKVKFHAPYKVFPPLEPIRERICEISGDMYYSDRIFEDYGFTKLISPKHIRKPENNIKLSNTSIQPIFRDRRKLQ